MHDIPEEAVKAVIGVPVSGPYLSKEEAVEIIEAALPFLPMRGAVKKLEWDEDWCAKTPLGMYTVQENAEDTWSFTFYEYPYGIPEGEFGTLDEAKAAAQQDYEARILSALELSAARELALGILPCWICGADEASTYLGEPGPGAVKCFAVGCDAEISGFSSDEEAIAEWNRRSLAMDAAMTEAYCTSDQDDLTECFQHHIRTSIGWQAFGARPGKEMQMYEEGFKAGYRRCKSDNEPELGEKEELSQRARKLVGRLRESIKAGAVNLSDVEDAVDLILDQDARSLSSPDHADAGKVEGDGLPQDVINLVIAAREVWEEADTLSYYHTDEEFSQRVEALDKALEPFGERVPFENEPDALPSAPSEGAE